VKNNENKMMNLFKTNSNEYMQIDQMSLKLLETLNKLNWVVIDPGMNSLLTMLSKDGKKSYTYPSPFQGFIIHMYYKVKQV
jgi:hypothetical protein